MSTMTLSVTQEDEVFAAFALGQDMHTDMVRSLPLAYGHHALVSHGVTVALRDAVEHRVVFDAMPHAEGERCVCRVMAHVGRAGVHVHEHFADGEVCALDHGAFVALAGRLGG